jgi:5-methyltetrahydrofolate corrinoid/iron sulfur protein methyltransferase
VLILGESIRIMSARVKAAIDARDTAAIEDLATSQADAGAGVIELNIGPAKKTGMELMPWLVDVVQNVVDRPLSLDTPNAEAIEAGLKRAKLKPFINSTSAERQRLEKMMPLASQYDANIVALLMSSKGVPATADEGVKLVMEELLPAAAEFGVPELSVYFDPLVLSVYGNQDRAMQVVETIRALEELDEPPVSTIVGLSNVSNGAPAENRSLINRIFLVMLMAAGLDAAIADALDPKLMETIRIVESRDNRTGVGQLLLELYDATAEGKELRIGAVDESDPEELAIWKTTQILYHKVPYTHSYLST